MDQAAHNKIVSFIWGIADDVLRDLFKRGKYPDVILPMCVLRRLDAVLEPTKEAVLDAMKLMDDASITEQHAALCQAAGQAFYNKSPFKLQDFKARGSQQQLRQDFEAYLDGFSLNVQEILDNFKFRNQIPTLSKADALGTLIGKFLDPEINLSPNPVLNADKSVKHPAMDNHAMGTVFEELVRKFNEENNEEAGEHWTPRDAVKLMANLIFLPIADKIQSGSYLLYDGAAGTGGMFTVGGGDASTTRAGARPAMSKPYSTGRRSTLKPLPFAKLTCCSKAKAKTPTISSAGRNTPRSRATPSRPSNSISCSAIRPTARAGRKTSKRWAARTACATGASASPTLTITTFPRHSLQRRTDAFSGQYGLEDESPDAVWGAALPRYITARRSSPATRDRARATSAAGSSKTTGSKPSSRCRSTCFTTQASPPTSGCSPTASPRIAKGKVQLIDASQWFKPLRKNLGKKNCELSEEDIRRICDAYLAFAETEQSKIFPNEAFGYWKVTVERPLRLHSQLTLKAIESLRFASGDEDLRAALYEEFGDVLFENFHSVEKELEKRLAEWGNGSNGDEEEEDEEGATARKNLPEKKKKKLLDAKTWERDARLVEIATELRQAIGGELFTDHNIFRDAVEAVIREVRSSRFRRRSQAHPARRELARRERPARHRQNPQARQRHARCALRAL